MCGHVTFASQYLDVETATWFAPSALLAAVNGLRELWAIVCSTGTGVYGKGSSGVLN